MDFKLTETKVMDSRKLVICFMVNDDGLEDVTYVDFVEWDSMKNGEVLDLGYSLHGNVLAPVFAEKDSSSAFYEVIGFEVLIPEETYTFLIKSIEVRDND